MAVVVVYVCQKMVLLERRGSLSDMVCSMIDHVIRLSVNVLAYCSVPRE